MPNAVAIYLAGSKDRGNFGNVYDLKDGQLWKKFNLPNLLGDLKVWNSIFKDLTTKFLPTTVKSIFVNMHLCFERGFNYQKWFDGVKSVAIEHRLLKLKRKYNMV
uniref:LAGLIDADG endonuclease n=1 Tax=Panagrolaimus sp. JU765 TaxID=591449 RepID=A0AC34QB85_9BILA